MIIHTGLRTDIPAFYAEWLANRLREGYVCVRNPYSPASVTKYRLSPDVVDLIVFCTKNPSPLLPRMDLLKSYGQYWFVTITPYGRDIEPHVPDKRFIIRTFQKLSRLVGADSMAWRYDPILLTGEWTIRRHLSAFGEIAAKLEGYTHTCVISFLDLYRKVLRNFPEGRTVSEEERLALGREMIRMADSHRMVLRTCAEGTELAPYGADCSGCMTARIFEKAVHEKLQLPKKKTARRECACFLTNDIGAYDSCGHLCRYCYANANSEAVRRNMLLHDPSSPFLIGSFRPDDRIHTALQKSWLDRQLSLRDFMP